MLTCYWEFQHVCRCPLTIIFYACKQLMIYVVAISPKQCWLIWHSASVLWLYLTILIRMFELGRQAKKDSMARYGSTCYLSHSVPVSLSVSDSVSLQLYAICTLMKRRGGEIIILFIFQVHLNPSFKYFIDENKFENTVCKAVNKFKVWSDH